MSQRHHEQYELLIQLAIDNIEGLLDYWKIPWQKRGKEYDILAVWRGDKSFGSCSFNPFKGIGNDFAKDIIITDAQIKELGEGFTRSDYDIPRASFDIIGLCLRVYELDPKKEYHLAANLLEKDLKALSVEFNAEELAKRSAHRAYVEGERKDKQRERANHFWNAGKDVVGTGGETYLAARSIPTHNLDQWGIEKETAEPNMRFIRLCWDDEPKPQGRNRPAIVFKVSDRFDGELKSIHRVYLSDDHKAKANILAPKKRLASESRSDAIWFGEPDADLYVAEGPENALTLRFVFGCVFVCSTIDAGSMPHLSVPRSVRRLIVCPDLDEAGLLAAQRLTERFADRANIRAIIVPPPIVCGVDGLDWNDIAKLAVTQGRDGQVIIRQVRDYLSEHINKELAHC